MSWFWNWIWRKTYRPVVYVIPCPDCAGGMVKDIDGTCKRCNGANFLGTLEAKNLTEFLSATVYNPGQPKHIAALDLAMTVYRKRRNGKILVP